MGSPLPLTRWVCLALMVTVVTTRPAFAQDLTPATEPPSTDLTPEQPGLLNEPDAVHRAAVIFDRRFNSGELTTGPYTVYGKMIPGAGWISGGEGYRRWYAKDRAFIEGSGEISWRGYTAAHGRFELPRLAH